MNGIVKMIALAALGGLVGAGIVYLVTQPQPVAAIKPVSKPVSGGLSFPFLENKDRVDPNQPFLG